MISASWDWKIKIWNINYYDKKVVSVIKTLNGHAHCINSIAIDKNG